MNQNLFEMRLKALEKAGFKIRFETSYKDNHFTTYMVNDQGDVKILQSDVRGNGDINFQEIILSSDIVNRLYEEVRKYR